MICNSAQIQQAASSQSQVLIKIILLIATVRHWIMKRSLANDENPSRNQRNDGENHSNLFSTVSTLINFPIRPQQHLKAFTHTFPLSLNPLPFLKSSTTALQTKNTIPATIHATVAPKNSTPSCQA